MMKNTLSGAALLAPVLALAQQATSNSAPVTPPTSFGAGVWIVAALVIAVIAAAFFGYRATRDGRRNPPHGPQSPTPRGS